MDMLRNFILSEFNTKIGEELKERGIINRYGRGADHFEWWSDNTWCSGLILSRGRIMIWVHDLADKKESQEGKFDLHDPDVEDKILAWAEESIG
jgi:hypothetical protein